MISMIPVCIFWLDWLLYVLLLGHLQIVYLLCIQSWFKTLNLFLKLGFVLIL